MGLGWFKVELGLGQVWEMELGGFELGIGLGLGSGIGSFWAGFRNGFATPSSEPTTRNSPTKICQNGVSTLVKL